MASPDASSADLPEHVRKLVTEIEREIGEDDGMVGRESRDAHQGRDGRERDGDAAEAELTRPIVGLGSLQTPNGPVEEAVREILVEIGEDPDRQGLQGTPDRVHRMYAELTAGYHVDPDRLVNGAVFDVEYSEMVVVKDIPFYSLCEHHLLPFFGKAAVAYIPRGKVIGLSKIPRVVEMYARRLQVQERMTQQIADFLNDRLGPQGVGVVVEANHLCAVMRGIRKPGTVMTTSAVLGLFRSRDRTRAEFFSHLERRPPGD
jgi:GTP cyclohydrolase I